MVGMNSAPEFAEARLRDLGRSTEELLRAFRGGGAEGGEVIRGLAEQAVEAPITGSVVAVVEDSDTLRVVAVAGATGVVAAESTWTVPGTPVAEVLTAPEPLQLIGSTASPLVRALSPSPSATLLALPLRIPASTWGDPVAVGVLFLVADGTGRLDGDRRDALVDHAALVTLGLVAVRNARLYADARGASQAMSSFLNLIVHDLRSPLTVASGYVELLRSGTYGPPQPGWTTPLEMVTQKLNEAQRLVDDLLLAARLEHGDVPVDLRRLDLNEVVRRGASRVEGRARLAGATVEAVTAATPVDALGDSFFIDRVLDNLVNNAISYGGPAPSVRLSTVGSPAPAIRVQDSGIGIAPEMQERVFDRYFRIDRELPGTGFGLYVSRVLTEACGGTLRLERSRPDEGSTFLLELPAPALDTATR